MRSLGSILLVFGFLSLLGTVLPAVENEGSINLRLIPLPVLFIFVGIYLRKKYHEL
jgi:hypothetical protein